MTAQDQPPAWANCSSHLALGNSTFWVNSFQPNSDISGIGVVVSYLGTGWLSVLIVCCHYFISFDPEIDPFPSHITDVDLESGSVSAGEAVDWAPNVVDQRIQRFGRIGFAYVLSAANRVLPEPIQLREHIDRKRLNKAFEKCILTMCDIQILTGIGMLCSGFIVLPSMTIQSFDWAVIVQLSSFSNLTHQSGLIFLRSELHRKGSQRERCWRVLLMTVLAILLIVAMIPLAGFTWMNYDDASMEYSQPARPAVCLYTPSVLRSSLTYHNFFLTASFMTTMTSIVITVLSYSTRLVKLFRTSSKFVRLYFRSTVARHCRRLIMRVLQLSSTKGLAGTLFLRNPVIALYSLLRFAADFYSSTFSDILWLLLIAANGTAKLFGILFIPTNSLSNWIDTISNFGQVLPLLLLTAPILMMVQTFSAKAHASETITMPIDSQAIPGPACEHLELVMSAQRIDANVAEDPANDSREGLFSFQQYSQSAWLNPMTVLTVAGAILISWSTISYFTIDKAFPNLLNFNHKGNTKYMTLAALNFGLFGGDLMTMGYVIIVMDFHSMTGSKYFRVLIWVLVGSFITYMGWLCGGTRYDLNSTEFSFSALPLYGLPTLYTTICIGFIFYKQAR